VVSDKVAKRAPYKSLEGRATHKKSKANSDVLNFAKSQIKRQVKLLEKRFLQDQVTHHHVSPHKLML